ncbi:MAG: sulfatase family protein [Planctomycetota bacterium]
MILALTPAAFPGCGDTVPETTDKPNIIIILADDMGYGDLSCQNPRSRIKTPHLDQMAEEGMRFTDAHSPSACCTPTRYSLLTGRYCWRSRLKRGNLKTWAPPLLEAGRMTLPAMLKRHGYETAVFGKWHLGMGWPKKGDGYDFTKPIEKGPVDSGFDYFFGVDSPNYPPYCFIENDRTVGFPSEMKPREMYGHDGPMLPGWKLEDVLPDLTKRVVAYIEERSKKAPGKPFFLYFSLTAPHTPIAPTEEFIGKSEAGRYGDFVTQLDGTVGQVMKALKRSDLEGNTLVLFASDNGSAAYDGEDYGGEPGSLGRYGHDANGPLRGLKADIWEGGHRIPFIARWPKKIGPGTTSDGTICLVDIMATVAAIVGADLPEDSAEDSYNILPALLGQKLDEPIREATVLHSGFGMMAIRRGKWKLILGRGSGGVTQPRHYKPKKGESKGQLYDMEKDISETTNLYQQEPALVEDLTKLLERYIQEGRSAPIQ